MGVPLLLVTVNRGITVESWASWLCLRLMLHKMTRHNCVLSPSFFYVLSVCTARALDNRGTSSQKMVENPCIRTLSPSFIMCAGLRQHLQDPGRRWQETCLCRDTEGLKSRTMWPTNEKLGAKV